MDTPTNDQGRATGRSTVAGPPAGRAELPGRWHALTVGLVATFMTLLDVSIVNVALPSMERGLGASGTSVQWVVSGHDYQAAISTALLCASGLMLLALLLAVVELWHRRARPAPAPQPEHRHLHAT